MIPLHCPSELGESTTGFCSGFVLLARQKDCDLEGPVQELPLPQLSPHLSFSMTNT